MPFVTNLTRPDILRHKVEWEELVPWDRERLSNGQRLVAVLHKSDFASSVIDEVGRNGRVADLVVIDIDQGTRRIAADGHPPLDAPACDREDHERIHDPRDTGMALGR